jgi:GT2 family glycosyltransferase
MTTSLMIVTYNRLDLTKRMLKSLFENTDSPFRLIIVDNGSTDGTVEWLENDPWLKENIWNNKNCVGQDFVYNKENMGIAIGRNQGLKASAKYNDEYLSTLDNDIEFVPGWLSKSLDILSVNPKFAVGLNMEGVEYPIRSRHGKTFQYKTQGNLGTACTVFSRELHNQIGYFITEFGKYGEEDADYFFRARLLGWEMAYLPEMGIHFGQGELDVGPYREFKTDCHKNNLAKFRENCAAYVQKRKSLFIPFE